MLSETFSRRFKELDTNFESLPIEYNEYGGGSYPSGTWQRWATSCQNLIKAVFGDDSPHYENFVKSMQ